MVLERHALRALALRLDRIRQKINMEVCLFLDVEQRLVRSGHVLHVISSKYPFTAFADECSLLFVTTAY